MFDKVQSRSGGTAKQRVCDGRVQMEARSPVSQILKIRVWVFREPGAADLHRDGNGPVELRVEYGNQDTDKVSAMFLFLSFRIGLVDMTVLSLLRSLLFFLLEGMFCKWGRDCSE